MEAYPILNHPENNEKQNKIIMSDLCTFGSASRYRIRQIVVISLAITTINDVSINQPTCKYVKSQPYVKDSPAEAGTHFTFVERTQRAFIQNRHRLLDFRMFWNSTSAILAGSQTF